MLVLPFINWQLDLQVLGLLLDKQMWSLYIYNGCESTKRIEYRYREEVQIMWLQDYRFFCYKFNKCVQIPWY